jgi:leucyl aminopeptidase
MRAYLRRRPLVTSALVHVEATTEAPLATGADTIVIGVFEGKGVSHDVPDGTLGALLESGEARRALGHVAVAHAEGRRWIVTGLGARDEFDAEAARVVSAKAHARARELGASTLCWEVPHHVAEPVVAALVEGTLLHAYRFDRYKHAPAGEAQRIERLIVSAHHDVSGPVCEAAVITAAQNRARDLGNMPANELTPVALAEYALALADRHDRLTVSVLGEQEIRDAGMGAFAAVAQGSDQEARLIRLEYRTAGGDEPPLGLIGKAVTFDSGGLTVKPPATMHEMKFDMCGGAAVIEAIGALAELGAAVNVIGVVGATENLVGPAAMKPGDIVRALDGTTIEINNPDAEGRMVLADCVTYARRQGCGRLVDIATLTGAVVAALGSTFAGVFSNDEALAAELLASAERTGELLWRLPLHPDFARDTKGRYADLTNRPEPREGLAGKAAEMIHHFAGDLPWAHLDIAGTAWNVRRSYLNGKGATGFGVRLLVDFARSGGPAPGHAPGAHR